jgi:hypothetical protein
MKFVPTAEKECRLGGVEMSEGLPLNHPVWNIIHPKVYKAVSFSQVDFCEH